MGPPAALDTIPDLAQAVTSGLPGTRHQLSPAFGYTRRVPLIPGTERFAGMWLPVFHGDHHGWIKHDIAAYRIPNAQVSGQGNIWLGGRLVTAPEIMPSYVAVSLDIAHGGNDRLHGPRALPIRRIDRPCLVATGHGIRVYGHFLIQTLFRILIARAALRAEGIRYGILMERSAPPWLLQILTDHLAIPADDIVFYDAETEQVELPYAILASLPLQEAGFHPAARGMIQDLLTRIDFTGVPQTPRRVFVARRRFNNPAGRFRICQNEGELIQIAARRHGFTPVIPEELSWPHQVALFRDAEMVLGLAGSGLHNALFSEAGSRVASIGVINFTQSEIGHLNRQHNAFLTDDIPIDGEFEVKNTVFTAYLDAVCEWPGGPPRPRRPS
jgi:capsular polysaccharide biosynthesis protein